MNASPVSTPTPTHASRAGGRTPWLLAAVLLLGLVAPAAMQAQVLDTYLVVAAVDFPDGQPAFVAGEAVARPVVVTVRNDGDRVSAGYELMLYMEEPDGTRNPLNGGNPASSGDAGQPLLSGQERKHPVTWTPTEAQAGAGKLLVEVRETDDLVRERFDVFVSVHDLRLTAPDEPVVLAPDQTVHIPVTVDNRGNTQETVEWSATRVPSRLRASFLEPSGQFAPGQHDAVLAVTYPFQGDLQDVRDLRIEVRATTQEQQRFVETPEIDIIHGDPPPPPSLSLTGPARTVFADPGQTVGAAFTLTNTGGQADVYSFIQAATGGWTDHPLTVDGQQVESVSLAAGQSRTLVVPVTPPTGADRLAELRLTARSQGGITDGATATLALTGALPVITGVTLAAAPVYVEEPLRVVVAYRNAGNDPLEDATLTVTVDYEVGATETRSVALAELLPDRDRTATVDVGLAQGAGQTLLTATIAAGGEQASATSVDLVRSGVLHVARPDRLVGLPGEQVRYHTPPHAFQVRNDGNAVEDVTVTAQGADVVGDDSFALAPGEVRTVAVTQRVPGTVGDARVLPVTLTAALDDAPDRTAAATVRTPVRDDTPPTVAWLEVPDAMLPSDARPLRVQAADDTFVVHAWVRVAPTDPDAPPEAAWDVELREGDDDWIALLRSRSTVGAYQLTPHAQDAFGNIGTGPTRTLRVDHAPAAPEPEPVAIDDVAYENGTLTVRTNASSILLIVDGNRSLHDVTDGELVLELDLDGGDHAIQVAADRADGSVAWRNTTVQVLPEAGDGPGLFARLTPGPGVALAAAAVLAVALRRRQRA